MQQSVDIPDFFHPIDHLFAQKICPNAPHKASIFLAYLLKTAREGHLCVDSETLLEPSLIEGASLLPDALFGKWLVKEKNRYYLRRNWECENNFLTHLQRLKFQKPSLIIPVAWMQKRLMIEKLNAEQKEAMMKVAANTLTLISGGPGTGKTYTAAALIRIFFEQGIKEVVVAAPTGKATANMRIALGSLADRCTIKTLQALLKQQMLYADLIIVDEGSMVDAEHMAALFSLIKDNSRLVLLGDKNQLPPVESGNFFADLAEDKQCVTELKTCLRTELQHIINLADKVQKGEFIPYQPLPDLKTLLKKIMNQKAHVLTPLRKGPYGVDMLNQALYREFCKEGAKTIPIMITVNDPHLELFNGDVGVLALEEKMAYFSQGRQIAEYLLPRYEYAYVLSVHKSQGSEYDKVLILLPQGSEAFGREMLYTALTRAKKEVEILAVDEKTLQAVLTNQSRRQSGVTTI